jgi:hypothetical protein
MHSDCVFRTHLGTDSGDTWAPVPTHLGTDAEGTWALVPGTWASIPEHLGRKLTAAQNPT